MKNPGLTLVKILSWNKGGQEQRSHLPERIGWTGMPTLRRGIHRAGFTLVELLVVIAIIGMLMGLLMPAVQQAREAARNLQCTNNLRNQALACVSHSSIHETYPTGGWGWQWTGDPDRGFSWQQPGGVFYNILPFMEQNALYQLTAANGSGSLATRATTLMQTPLPVLYCPSRRTATTYQYSLGNTFKVGSGPTSFNLSMVARSDYAGNGGTTFYEAAADGGSCFLNSYSSGNANEKTCKAAAANFNGMFGNATVWGEKDIYDGTSYTLLLGEKYLCTEQYSTGTATDDNEGAFIGHNSDVTRFSIGRPFQDRQGYTPVAYFGSTHAGGFNGATCDGAVRRISYNVDLTNFRYFTNRSDGEPLNMNTLD